MQGCPLDRETGGDEGWDSAAKIAASGHRGDVFVLRFPTESNLSPLTYALKVKLSQAQKYRLFFCTKSKQEESLIMCS